MLRLKRIRLWIPNHLPLPLPPLGAMSGDEMMGLGEEREAKLRRTRDGAAASSRDRGLGQPQGAVREILGDAPTVLGRGEHERPILEAVLLGLQDLNLEVQEVKAMHVLSWELPRDSLYVAMGIEYKDLYIEKCREVKGQGIDLGHQKNYVFLGLYMAAKKAGTLSAESLQVLRDEIGNKIKNSEGKPDLGNAQKIAHLVGFCQVSRSRKKGFVNVYLRGRAGERVMEILGKEWDKIGKAQWDPQSGKPIHKDVKDGVLEMKKKKGGRR